MGQNVATTWTFDREPMDKDKPEFRRHIKAWFDEVSAELFVKAFSKLKQPKTHAKLINLTLNK